jgi:hypothetical protein
LGGPTVGKRRPKWRGREWWIERKEQRQPWEEMGSRSISGFPMLRQCTASRRNGISIPRKSLMPQGVRVRRKDCS